MSKLIKPTPELLSEMAALQIYGGYYSTNDFNSGCSQANCDCPQSKCGCTTQNQCDCPPANENCNYNGTKCGNFEF